MARIWQLAGMVVEEVAVVGTRFFLVIVIISVG